MQNCFEHAGVNLPQFGQRQFNITALAFEMLDLLNAFLAADRQGLVTAAGAGGEHFADFTEGEAQALALEDKVELVAVDRGVEAGMVAAHGSQ